MKPKILLLFTGGTIAQIKDPILKALVPAKTTEDLLRLVPELNEHFSIDTVLVENLDSSNIQPAHWVKLAATIYKHYSQYDGFVITHGTDTMSYTASALSFALQNLGKPVVFTGSQLPGNALGSDARTNLIHAFQVASMDIAEVVIVFGTKVLRGNRSSKQSESALDAFWSPVFSDLGKIRLEIELYNHHKKRDESKQPVLTTHFEENIAVITLTPGIKPLVIDTLIDAGVKGIILQGFGAGNLPIKENSLIASIKNSISHGVPVVITSQCAAGVANVFIYETGIMAQKTGAISAEDMTLEAAATKLMWILSNKHTMSEIDMLLHKNFVGEITQKHV